MTDDVTVYGADWCEDTQATRNHLDSFGVQYHYVDVDRDPDAQAWVKRQNGGKQKTPTLDIAGQIAPHLNAPFSGAPAVDAGKTSAKMSAVSLRPRLPGSRFFLTAPLPTPSLSYLPGRNVGPFLSEAPKVKPGSHTQAQPHRRSHGQQVVCREPQL